MSFIKKVVTALVILQAVTASPAPWGHGNGKGHWRSKTDDGSAVATGAPDSSTVPAAAGTSAAAPASTGTTSTGSSGKRGISYNQIADLQAFSGQGKISWTYNWYSNANGQVPSGIKYIPLLWGGKTDATGVWFKNAKDAITAGADTILAFNEPDHPDQANLDPATAASLYKQYMQPFADGSGQAGGAKARLGSPAVTNGGAPMGLDWLGKFISACSGCTIDVVAIHWYGSGTDADGFISHVKSAYAAGGNRPLWITEFAPASSDPAHPEVVEAFFAKVLPFLDSYEGVEKYAYFFDAPGAQAVSGGKITNVGSAYAAA